MTRIIQVEKCSVVDCPYCIPDSYSKVNFCHFYGDPFEIDFRTKTFPKGCPLKEEEDK